LRGGRLGRIIEGFSGKGDALANSVDRIFLKEQEVVGMRGVPLNMTIVVKKRGKILFGKKRDWGGGMKPGWFVYLIGRKAGARASAQM